MTISPDLIRQAKEKLGERNLSITIEELGITDFDSKSNKCCCPFHNEDHASFVYYPDSYSFHCYGQCGRNYDLIDVFMHKGMTFAQACRKLFDLADIPYSFGEIGVKTRREYRYPHEVECKDKSIICKYYELRKISPETLDYADVRQDEHGNIVFNYYDTNDVLTMVKYRPSRKINKGDNKCWCQPGADTTPLLFNMNRININVPLLICEGESDCLSAIEAGYTNAVSVPLGAGNFRWIEENWDWLEQFDSIIICSDNDESGLKMQKECVSRLERMRTKVIDIPLQIELEDGRKRPIKDLNEYLYFCGKSAVMDLISTAKETPVPSLVDFSDIEDINIQDIDGVETGIFDLDRELTRLFYSTLTILSGTPGSGKTSFLYQMLCNCMDNQKPCWLFSRELPEWMTKNWMNFILAGRRNINEYVSREGSTYYRITNEAKQAISEKYKGLLKVYRDDYPNGVDTIKESMIAAARKYGCKLFIVDNLTTVDLDASDENRNGKQTAFVNWLIEFSMKYNVATVLVCHPRKMLSTANNVGMYDISGTSNIINLAHRAIGLRRVTPKEKRGGSDRNEAPCAYDVILNVIKDRMGGKQNVEVGLYYDKPSRRFFSCYGEYDCQYTWDTKHYTEMLACEPLDADIQQFGYGEMPPDAEGVSPF